MRIRYLTLCLLVLPAAAAAGPHDFARFALEAKDPFSPTKSMGLCGPGSYDPNAQGTPCPDYDVTRPIRENPGPLLYLVVAQLGSVGITGASCGIDYTGGSGSGVDPAFVTWTGCTDGLEFPNAGPNGDWPAPGGGIRIAWITCQNQQVSVYGVHAVLGCFYVYAYSEAAFKVTPNNNLSSGPELAVTACGGGTTDLLTATVQFGGYDQAWNPCGEWPWWDVSIRETTWGRLKRQYEQ